MDKTSIYVKKIFIFLLVSVAVLVAIKELNNPFNYIIIPIALLTISLLHLGFAGIKPPYLFTLDKSDQFINNKNSFWMFFKPLLILTGFVYDIIVWTIWGVYLIYEFILDIIQLIKTILYWIFYAILWFLKLYVPPIRLLYRWFIYYLIRWPWWLYKLSFVNINNAFKRNYYFVSVWGTIIGLEIIFLFYFIGVITGKYGLVAVGIILSILPFAWSFGEISNIKKEGLVKKPYWEVRKNFNNGMESVRNILIYLVIFLVLAIIQIFLDMAGWIPTVGYSFLGIAFNINTLISFILIVLAFILFFASAILPTNLLFGGKSQLDLNEMLSQLGIISRKFFRVLFVSVPSSFFGVFVLLLPAILFVLTVGLTIEIKDNVLETRITTLKERSDFVGKGNIINPTAIHRLEIEIERLKTYQEFPFITFGDIMTVDALKNNIKTYQNNLGVLKDKLAQLEKTYDERGSYIGNEIERAQQIGDMELRMEMEDKNETERKRLEEDYRKNKADLNIKITNTEKDIKYAKNYSMQTYVVFFFVGIWLSVFAGFVIAFFISFLGNIYYDLYHFNEDGKPVYLMQKVYEENETDSKQPLLGFTLLVITALIIIFNARIIDFITENILI